jgi:hypothetical protein
MQRFESSPSPHGGTSKLIFHFPRNPTYENVYMTDSVVSGDSLSYKAKRTHTEDKHNLKYELTKTKPERLLVVHGDYSGVDSSGTETSAVFRGIFGIFALYSRIFMYLVHYFSPNF